MIVQGTENAEVIIEENKQIISSLEKRKIPNKFLTLKDNAHTFMNEKNITILFRELNRFLQTHFK